MKNTWCGAFFGQDKFRVQCMVRKWVWTGSVPSLLSEGMMCSCQMTGDSIEFGVFVAEVLRQG